jgi:hypothetical protein
MRYASTIFLAAAFGALATAASAAPWTAVPVQPSSQTGFVGDSVIWSCGASGCVSQSDTSNSDAMSECVALARQLGPLTSFTRQQPFDAAHLAECNAAAPKAKH